MTRTTTRAAAFGLIFAGAIALSACSSGDSTMDDSMAGSPMPEEPTMAAEPTMEATDGADATMDDPYAMLVGTGCSAYDEQVPDGAGSIQGMSQDPVAVAASSNPLLTTLVAAVSGGINPDVNLVDTLNGDEFTVFAPVDDAFAQIDEETLGTLAEDADLLTSILTYHVVPGQIEPDAIAGTHTTVNGADLEVTGSGDSLMVNGTTTVVCGGVQTANATVYLIDSVLMPPAS